MVGCCCCCAATLHAAQVVVDDLGWHNVEWHNPDMKTPRSMELVHDGVMLEKSCASPLAVATPRSCEPSHALARWRAQMSFNTVPRHAPLS